MSLTRQAFIKFSEQFLLPRVEIDGNLHSHLTDQVSLGSAANRFYAFTANAEHLSILGTGGDLELDLAAQGRNLKLTSQRCRCHGDRHLAKKMAFFAAEDGMRLDVDFHVEIPRLATTITGLAFTRQADAIASVHTRRNLYGEGFLLLDPTLTATIGAWGLHHRPLAMTLGTGLLDGEESLLNPDLALTLTGRTGLGAGSRFGAATIAGNASGPTGNPDLYRGSGNSILERQLQRIAQVRSPD